MTPRILSEEEYQILKKKLHQAHDKLIKIALHEEGAMRELTEKIIMPLLDGIKIDLDSLALDTTTYIRQNLKVFFSDIVYMANLIDKNTDTPEPAKVAVLIEHKSDMPTQLAMRLQAMDYINAIMKKNYNKDLDKTIPVITVIFNQFDKDWIPKSFRSQFPTLSNTVARLIPDFDLLVINLASLPDEIMVSLDEFGTLKATLLAMKNVRNKRFLKRHFEEIFLFLQQHPEKTDLRDQLITYLLGYGDMTNKDFEELLANIFSPVLKQEIMTSGTGFLAVAAREAAASARKEAQEEAKKAAERVAKKAKLELERAREETLKVREEAQKREEEAQKKEEEAQKKEEEAQKKEEEAQKKEEEAHKKEEEAQKKEEEAQKKEEEAQKKEEEAQKKEEKALFKTKSIVMHSWHRGLSLDLITDIVQLEHNETRQLIAAFEKVKTTYYLKTDIDNSELIKLSGLSEFEVKYLLALLQKS
jgi:Putative transposase, YhgA-like/High-temperature-induced dauer-formation protein